jgi:16S rRNA (guanine(966)-N(2))-methyltransferase RsmD
MTRSKLKPSAAAQRLDPSTRPARPVRTQRTRADAPQEVRIIGGLWKRTPLPVADLPGLRPTPARVRETLFNWLGQDLSGWRCVDAFAGSGALGLEAASRGAAEVLLIEHNAQLVDSLRQIARRLLAGAVASASASTPVVRVERADALASLQRLAGQGWDVVFLDPPFEQGGNDALFAKALAAAAQALAATGLVYLESPRAWSDAELAAVGLVALKRGQAGAVHHSLLQRLAPASAVNTQVYAADSQTASAAATDAAVDTPAGA